MGVVRSALRHLITLLRCSKHSNPLLLRVLYAGLRDNIKVKVTQEGKALTLDALIEPATRWDIRLASRRGEETNDRK